MSTVNTNDPLERIKQLIAEQQGYPPERITLETRLQTDTGMAGDDGCRFLRRFQDEFDVDLSALRYGEHFEPEGLPFTTGLVVTVSVAVIFVSSYAWPWLIPIWAVAVYYCLRKDSQSEHPGEIRVSDLLRSAEARRWSYGYKVGS